MFRISEYLPLRYHQTMLVGTFSIDLTGGNKLRSQMRLTCGRTFHI